MLIQVSKLLKLLIDFTVSSTDECYYSKSFCVEYQSLLLVCANHLKRLDCNFRVSGE